MKTKIALILTTTALLAGAVIAQPQPPQPPAPPAPPNAPSPPAPPNHDPHKNWPKVPVTFLGVETSSVPKVVCDQLNLAKGFGLVVDYVVPDGPAAAAGVQTSDILKMLNDQILTEPDQLSKLIRSFPEGTTVTFTVLRKGQEQKIPVKLGKKEVPQKMGFNPGDIKTGDMDMGDMNEWVKDLQGSMGGEKQDIIETAVRKAQEQVARVREQAQERAQEQAERVREQAQEQVQRVREQTQEQAQRIREQAQRMRERAQEMRERTQERRANGQIQITRRDDTGLRTTRIDINKAQITFSDDKGELRIDNNDGKKILTAKDPQGRLLFSGPIETKEDLDKVPADVRQRYEQLQQKDLPSVNVNPDNGEANDQDEDADDTDEDNDDSDSRGAIEQVSTHRLPWTMFSVSDVRA